MKEYIPCEALIEELKRRDFLPVIVKNAIQAIPAADVVSKGLYEQIKWERDLAIEQLEEYGVSLGEKADVVKVRHAKWELDKRRGVLVCPECASVRPYDITIEGYEYWDCDYCSNCGAKMDKEET